MGSRRQARRLRRDRHRAGNKRKRLRSATLEHAASLTILEQSARLAARNVAWKTGTQRYMLRLLPNAIKAHSLLLSERDFTQPRTRFTIMERGKLRDIQAARFSERVIQKAIARTIVKPSYQPSFTTGNSANMQGRGTKYAMDRLKQQLVRHYRRHGRDGWILLMDFHDYFNSIDRSIVYRQACERIDDPAALRAIRMLLDAEQGDKGLGLGSEPNQLFAVNYPSRIDHWLEERSGVEASGRYMDDTYAISADKALLWNALGNITWMAYELGLTLNPRKTKIVKLSHGFTWLKKKWSITDTGRIVVRPCRKSIVRERRKLKHLSRLAVNGIISEENMRTAYQSWRGGLKRLNSGRTLRNMDALYKMLPKAPDDEA